MSISQNFPDEGPTLNLNFAGSKVLDPRITFSRANTTATYVDDNGLIVAAGADEPRFDHDFETGESLGLLVEEQRTNLLPYSVVDSTNWSVLASTVTDNDATAPDGTNTAARIQVHSPGSSGGYVTKQSIGVTTGTEYTFSFYVKSQSGSSGTWGINIYDHGGANFGHNRTDVDITGEWTRVSYSYTPTSGTINVYVSDDRDNTTTISDAYVWGAQLEVGAFPTSYIPTSGSEATRNPDNVSMTGTNFSDWYNTTEGTLYVRANTDAGAGLRGVAAINRPSNFANDRVDIRYDQSGNSRANFNSTSLARTSGFNFYNPKFILSYEENYRAYGINADITQSTSSFTPSTNVDTLMIGNFDAGTNYYLCGTISQLTYYPTRLSNTVLQNLTK